MTPANPDIRFRRDSGFVYKQLYLLYLLYYVNKIMYYCNTIAKFAIRKYFLIRSIRKCMHVSHIYFCKLCWNFQLNLYKVQYFSFTHPTSK
jgi:hypothetical protein